jgi:hypothetical protein
VICVLVLIVHVSSQKQPKRSLPSIRTGFAGGARKRELSLLVANGGLRQSEGDCDRVSAADR